MTRPARACRAAHTVPFLLTLAAFTPDRAVAHGGIPQSSQVVFPEGEDSLPLVVTTFGVLAPAEGNDWTWICEDVSGQSSMTAFAALSTGEWFMGSTTGLKRSEDRCHWSTVEGGLAGLFVTQASVDMARPDRLWVSTSTGGDLAHNALWYSDDGGETFQEGHYFGEGSTIRGFLQGEDGLPWYTVFWRGGLPYLGYSANGDDWIEHPITGAELFSVYPMAIDAADPLSVYLVWRAAASDQLVRMTADGEITEPLLELSTRIDDLFSGPAEGELWAASRPVGLFHSIDGGETWSGPDPSPEAGCLVGAGTSIYQCTNNYADQAAVMRFSPGSDTYEPVLWFGDVRAPEECPEDSEVYQICVPLWEVVKVTAGLDIEEETPTPEPTATPEPETGCGGCDTGRAGSSGGGGSPLAWAAALALGVGMYRSRRPAG